MGPLPKESRTRVRALLLWGLAGAVTITTLVYAYALVIGFALTSSTRVEQVAVINEGQGLLVNYAVGSSACAEPNGVVVTETGETITLEGRSIEPAGTSYDHNCTDDLYYFVGTIWLDEPVGNRTIERPDGTVIELVRAAEMFPTEDDLG